MLYNTWDVKVRGILFFFAFGDGMDVWRRKEKGKKGGERLESMNKALERAKPTGIRHLQISIPFHHLKTSRLISFLLSPLNGFRLANYS